jgi:hypothetical protein
MLRADIDRILARCRTDGCARRTSGGVALRSRAEVLVR